MKFAIRQVNPHACKTYLLTVPGSREAVLVDPVLDHLDDYLGLLGKEKLELALVVDTHTHADHISCGAALKDKTGCRYVMHGSAPAECADTRVGDGDEMVLPGGIPARFLATPGHTADSVSMVLPGAVMTGDALFLDDGGAGRDDLPGGDPGAHWDSLQKLMRLDGGTVVYPAHEYRNREPSTLAHQKRSNPHLAPRTRDEFIQFSRDLKLGPAAWMADVLKANYACARDPKAAWIPVDTPACEVMGTMDPGVNEVVVGRITAAALRKELAAGRDLLLLDVRDPEELRQESIAGVVNIPVQQLSQRLGELEAAKSRDIVTICRAGARAHTAAQIMKKAGFENVRLLEGGMSAWKV